MKKSQILAAIALALSLGVVIPVAGVSAVQTEEQEATWKKAETAVKAAKASFGTVTKADDSVVDAYDQYTIFANNTKIIDDAIKAAKDIKSDATGTSKTLMTSVDGEIAAVKTEFSASLQAKLDSDAWKKGTYDEVMAIAKLVKSELNNLATNGRTTAIQTAAATAYANVVTAISTAEGDLDAIVAGQTTETAALAALYNALTKNAAEAAPATLKDYNALVAKLSVKLPELARFKSVNEILVKIDTATETDAMTPSQVEDYIAKLNKAVNGTTTPSGDADKDEDTEKDPAGAPDSGILGTAEGTATTVSIVAGLATALTALGAGVVAYRSARRK